MTSEWKIQSLREAGVSLIDCDHRTPPAAESGYPYVAIPQLKQGRLDLSDVRRITREHFLEWTRKANPQTNDVILSRRCNPGETSVVPDGLECALGQNLVLLRADASKLFPPFLRWLVRGSDWWEQIGKFLNVGAVFDSLKCADIPNFRLPIPPFAEQQAIAGVLGALDDKIELNRRMNETLETLARSFFKSHFVDAVATKLPKGWRAGKLRDCCERVENGGTPKRDEPSYWTPATVPWLTSGEVRQAIVTKTDNFISEEGLENSSAKLWPPATTVVALYGATAGQVCFLGDTMCSNQACCGLIPKKDLRYYVYLHASSSVAAFEQQTRGSAQQNLSQQIVADFPTVIPDDDTLAEFDQIVHPLFSRWIDNLKESRTLAELRDALLPKLLSGELRVPAAANIKEAVA
ncbi:MAG: restriction endonuclease subunit S [Verrucomicrobiota bacterium]|jgi:type I restriction enzyme S subunit